MIPKYKDIIDLIKKGSTVEAQEKIMELREVALELQEENLRLREQLHNAEQALKQKDKMVYEAPFYWVENNKSKDGPYCQNCFDSEGKQIHLQHNGNDYWTCLSCGKGYEGPNYQPFDAGSLSDDYDYFN